MLYHLAGCRLAAAVMPSRTWLGLGIGLGLELGLGLGLWLGLWLELGSRSGSGFAQGQVMRLGLEGGRLDHRQVGDQQVRDRV